MCDFIVIYVYLLILLSLFQMRHARTYAPAAAFMGQTIAVLAGIVPVERRKLAVESALAKRNGTGHLVPLRPFHLNAADDLLHGLRRRNRMAVAVQF